jgi:hypothetical protein
MVKFSPLETLIAFSQGALSQMLAAVVMARANIADARDARNRVAILFIF